MKRFLITLFIVVFIPICAFAQELDREAYEKTAESFSLSEITDSLDSQTRELLENLGVEDFDYENLLNLTPKRVFNALKNIVTGKAASPFLSMAEILILVMLSSLFKSMQSTIQSDSLSDVYSLASAVTIALILCVKLNNAITIACASLGICANFIFAFIPIFAIIVVSTGSITVSLTTNALLLGLAQIMNLISDKFFLPIINCFLGISICAGLRPQLNLSRAVGTAKKYITSAISVISAAFVSILSLKTAVASRADAIGMRSLRFAVNSVVPVIGSAISEGILSIQSYSDLIKSSVGVVGIIIVILIFLPSLVEILLWRLVISICLICSDLFDDKAVKAVLGAFNDTLMLLCVLLVLSMVTTVISLGILLAARSV